MDFKACVNNYVHLKYWMTHPFFHFNGSLAKSSMNLGHVSVIIFRKQERHDITYPCPDRSQAMLSWWRHQRETFSALLALCAVNSRVTGQFPAQRLVTLSFVVFFGLRLNKRLSKQPWGWWLETPSRTLWRHSNLKTGPSYSHWNIYSVLGAAIYTVWNSVVIRVTKYPLLPEKVICEGSYSHQSFKYRAI